MEEENTVLRARMRAIQAFESRRKELELYNQNLREKILVEKSSIKKFAKEIEQKKKNLIDDLNKQNEKIYDSHKDTKLIKNNTEAGKKNLILQKNRYDSKIGKFIDKRNQLKDENFELKVGQIVDQDTIGEYQHLNFRQSKKIKSLQTELQYVKYRLSEKLYEFSNQVEMLKKSQDEMVDNHRKKIEEVLDHINFKNKEISNLRFLSKATIDQRTKLTDFFIESLNFTKEKIEKEAKKKAKDEKKKRIYSAQRTQLPYTRNGKVYWGSRSESSRSIKSAYTVKSNNRGKMIEKDIENEKVDFGDLNWNDKEKILRSLFAKVNTGVNVKYWKQLNRIGEQRNKNQDGISREIGGEEEEYDMGYEDEDEDVIMMDV